MGWDRKNKVLTAVFFSAADRFPSPSSPPSPMPPQTETRVCSTLRQQEQMEMISRDCDGFRVFSVLVFQVRAREACMNNRSQGTYTSLCQAVSLSIEARLRRVISRARSLSLTLSRSLAHPLRPSLPSYLCLSRILTLSGVHVSEITHTHAHAHTHHLSLSAEPPPPL
jgi:hypothetical protein